MRTHKVRLYIRVRLPNGRHSFVDPVWNRNQTLRSGYALISGKPEYHQKGVYFYSVPNLTPGNYEVTVSSKGFSTVLQRGIVLTVSAQQTFSPVLAIGKFE